MNLDQQNQWSESNLVPIPKRGNLSQVSNYRGISISQVILKVVNIMIFHRIQPILGPLLRTNQNGIRPGRSTTAQILTLRRIIEALRARNLPAVITFIDCRKAFGSINRRKMLQIFKAYGIPHGWWTPSIGETFQETRTNVLSPDGETEFFKITTGVPQGDTLAPYLFIIVLDYVPREAIEGHEESLGLTIKPRQGRRVKAEKVTNLNFAYDIALFSDQFQQVQDLLRICSISASQRAKRSGNRTSEYDM